MTTVSFEPLAGPCPNPERGLCRYTATSYSRPEPLQSARLRRWRQSAGITLVFRHVELPRTPNGRLDRKFMEGIECDFEALRHAGLKCILRFSYGAGSTGGLLPPHGDAPKETVLGHIRQLAPVLHENIDVLAILQAGFVGRWGEWHYTDHFGGPASPTDLSARDLARRREVLAALLDAVDSQRKIQVRSVPLKRALLGLPTGSDAVVTEREAHGPLARARIGVHNDCFLSDRTDSGTYDPERTRRDRGFLARDSLYVPVGGETCRAADSRATGGCARREMERYHWSYLNQDYHPEVIGAWRNDRTLDVVQARLGYRLELQSASLTRIPGDPHERLVIRLVNRGWAPPYNPRAVRLILRGRNPDREHSVTLNVDPRFWLPDEPVLLTVPLRPSRELAPGRYALRLHLPDPEASLSRRPEYSVRLANRGTWEPDTGYNRLGLTARIG